MDAGTMLAIAKLGGFAILLRAWWVAKKSAEACRAERAAREAALSQAQASEARPTTPDFSEAA
ncbi:MAG: hypothetical protein AAFS07_16110 [Pseudomonadota bacterium]